MTPGGTQETWIINESGLYNAILRSDKPEEMTKAILKHRQTEGINTQEAKRHRCRVAKNQSLKPSVISFSPKQVEWFETLADNRDLVELERAHAREEGRISRAPFLPAVYKLRHQ